MATVLITGGTGMIGTALTHALLEKNYKVIILSRKKAGANAEHNHLSHAYWDLRSQTIDKNAISAADFIVHLAGAGIADKRWTRKRKREIRDSRVKSSELIVKSLQEIPNNVRAVISASAVGWYGADPVIPNPRLFGEDDPAADGFLGETCKQWEASIEPVTDLGKRLVKLRTAIVLSNKGGALKEFKRPLRFGVAPFLGNGRQVMSWIHIDDLVRLYIAAIEDEKMSGVYNAAAPNPVSNKTFTLKLAQLIKGQFFIPVYVPTFALRLVLGEMSIEILKSATVSCDKVHKAGFTFLYPSVDAALLNLK
jgi:uncharacterized protein (TIGR01777 family)